jgi:hypothetical protein
MKLLNIETPVTRHFIRQFLLNVQDFYFHKVGYTSYDEGIFGPYTDLTRKLSGGGRPMGRPLNRWEDAIQRDSVNLLRILESCSKK